MARVCVLGLGYIGLPTASIFATHGYDVIGVDTNPQVVETINRGKIHIQEPGLATTVLAAVHSGRFRAVSTPEKADAFILCVPTPLRPSARQADLSFVERAARSILPVLSRGNLVVLESTVPPQTTTRLLVPIVEECGLRCGRDLFVAYCPERVMPGRILEEFTANDRLIGGIDARSCSQARALYAPVVDGQLFCTDPVTAEIVKLVENSFRDVNIAFANEIAAICTHLGSDVQEVIRLANRHPRVNMLQPGPGVGGHCIALDPWFLIQVAPRQSLLLRCARKVNEIRPQAIVRHIEQTVAAAHLRRPVIACLGLTYKADVDDVRESPSLEIVHRLRKKGYTVLACDPYVRSLDGLALVTFPTALQRAHLVTVLVGHREFREASEAWLRRHLKGKKLIDIPGIWSRPSHSGRC